uniref:Uncharacterized protein n=1 Tax=Arundo donax TaxID=35708 RepID=A0A0A9BR56_ARUDO
MHSPRNTHCIAIHTLLRTLMPWMLCFPPPKTSLHPGLDQLIPCPLIE